MLRFIAGQQVWEMLIILIPFEVFDLDHPLQISTKNCRISEWEGYNFTYISVYLWHCVVL
jgi:hypothetical protein